MDRLLDTNVRYFDNNVTTAQLKNEWGSIVKVLDEVLVYGSNEQNILSITTVEDVQDSRYWVSTILLNENHKFEKDLHVVEITDSVESKYNKLFRVQEAGSNFIKIAFLKSDTPVQPVDINTSQAKIKLAPLGYKITISADNKRVYTSADPKANPCYLRVDDSCPPGYDPTWVKFARVSMFSDIQEIDDVQPRPGRLKAPYFTHNPVVSEVPSGSGPKARYGFSKWYYATQDDYYGIIETRIPNNNGPFPFDIIGDAKTFYFFPGLVGYEYWFQKVGYAYGEYLDYETESNINNQLLCAHERIESAETSVGYTYNNPGKTEDRSAFSRLYNQQGKFMFNPDQSVNNTFSHIKFEFISTTNAALSGRDTGFSYTSNYQSLNLLPIFLRGFLTGRTVFKGKVRGYHFVGNNLQDYKDRYPKHKSIVDNLKNTNKKFILLTCFQSWGSGAEWDSWQNSRIAFLLNNWE